MGLAHQMPKQSGLSETSENLYAVLAFFSVVASSQIYPLVNILSEIGCKDNKNF